MFRKLARHRFCCDGHERTYLAQLQELAIERLHAARMAASAKNPGVEIETLRNDN